MEHSLKEKLQAIKLCNKGLPIFHVAKKLKCSKNVVTMWVEQYKLYGADTYRRMSEAVNPYGDGLACERITRYLCEI